MKTILAIATISFSSPWAFADAHRPLLVEDYQVLQRDAKDVASCLISIPEKIKTKTFSVKATDELGLVAAQADHVDISNANGGKGIVLGNIPVGGPYTITATAKDNPDVKIVFHRILVGDIWLLGGQSNMFGAAVQDEDLPALPYMSIYDNQHTLPDAHWIAGMEPIHRVPWDKTRNQFKKVGGAIGPAYFFARALYKESQVPIGFIPCAMGGALAMWDPDKRNENNRYAFMMNHIKKTGGRVKGLLWYQGEQDAIFGVEKEVLTKPSLINPIETYGREYRKFVEALRKDVNNPDMPFIIAQICSHYHAESYADKPDRYRAWERIREAQRLLADQIPHVHTVPTVDLDVWDSLHLDYPSQQRLAARMARLALPHVRKDAKPRGEIKLKSVKVLPKKDPAAFGPIKIVVTFDGVSGRLRAPGRPTGFQLRLAEHAGQDVNRVFKAEFDPEQPNTVILYTMQPQGLLYYAPGPNPYVNIVDEADMGVPAFGPVEVK